MPMDDPAEELEPLFDYSRVQPLDTISFDEDDSLEAFPTNVGEKRKRESSEIGKKGKMKHNVFSLDDDDDDDDNDGSVDNAKDKEDDDWLEPPPVIANAQVQLEEDQMLKELRLKKQEWVSLAESAKTVLKEVDDNARRAFCDSVNEDNSKPKESQPERQKIVISIQDKDGSKQFRIYKDDKLEKLFKTYAERAKVDMKNLVFCFDGDKVQAGCTPLSLGLEDDDMIEVHLKS